MDCDIHFVRGNSEEPARFDHFEPLVHEGGGVDRDFLAHSPRRMIERLCPGYRKQSFFGGFPEGSSRGRQNQAPDFAAASSAQALVDGIVLAVDGENLHALFFRFLHHELPRHHKSLFVSQSQLFSRLERAVGGEQPRRSRNGRERQCHFGMAGDLRVTLIAANEAGFRQGVSSLVEKVL